MLGKNVESILIIQKKYIRQYKFDVEYLYQVYNWATETFKLGEETSQE